MAKGIPWKRVHIQFPAVSPVFVVVMKRHNELADVKDAALGDIAFNGAMLDPGTCKGKQNVTILFAQNIYFFSDIP